MQHLVFNGCFTNGSLSALLSSCPNIINLAIHGHNTNLALQEMSHLSRLAVNSSYIQPHDESPIQPYLNLTRLNIHDSKCDSSWREWEFLAHLPKLTHISTDEAIKNHIPLVLVLMSLPKTLSCGVF